MASDTALAPLSFTDFLEKMKDPAAADLVRSIKGFIKHFDERPPGHRPDAEADSAAVQDFLSRMEVAFRDHPAWHGAGPDVIDQAVEGLEKYVMSKVWPRTFAATPEDRDRDERYTRLAQALSFVDLSLLAGCEVAPDEGMVDAAVKELLRMDRYKAPRDKLLCLVNVKTLVEDIVVGAAKGGASIGGGADAFFPTFLLVSIKAKLPRLASNVEYVRRFRARSRLSGQFDFMLCNLESAAIYLDTVDWRHLKLSQDEFLARLSEAGIPEARIELEKRGAAAAAAAAAAQCDSLELSAVAVAAAAVASPPEAEESSEQLLIEVVEDAGAAAASAPEEDLEATPAAAAAAAAAAVPSILDSNLGEHEGQNEAPTVPSVEVPSPPQEPSLAAGATEKSSSSSGGGLTPLPGGGPLTPSLITKKEAGGSSWKSSGQRTPRSSPAASAAVPAAPVAPVVVSAGEVIAGMVAEGTQLVLVEEAEGRLLQRHPWIYAAAEDLRMPEVKALLTSYRDLVFKYEALSLALQQQVCGGGAGGSSTAVGRLPGDEDLTLKPEAAPGSSGLLHRLASWGSFRSGASSRQDAAAVAGSSIDGSSNTKSDPRLLMSLFGASQQGGALKMPRESQKGGDDKRNGEGWGSSSGTAAATTPTNLLAPDLYPEALSSPTLGMVEQHQAVQDREPTPA